VSREGEARRPALLEPLKRSPHPALLPTVNLPLLSALPVCRLPQRRDRVPSGAGCGLTEHSESRPRRWKSEEWGRARRSEAESLDRCATLGQPHGGSVVKKASKRLDFGLYIIRDIADRGKLGLVLLGMPGLEKRIARAPQLYSRLGFNHEMEPLSDDETRFFLDQRWRHRVSVHSNDFTDQEAATTILRITRGNIRLIERLMMQVEHVLVANQITVVTKEVVETARKNLIIGPD